MTSCQAKAGFYGIPGKAATICPRNFYCPARSITPIPCPVPIPFSSLQSSNVNNCSSIMLPPCFPGYFLDIMTTIANNDNNIVSICRECPGGFYCPGDNTITACDPRLSWVSLPQSKSASDCGVFVNNNASIMLPYVCPQFTTGPIYAEAKDISVVSILQCRAMARFYFIAGIHTTGILCPPSYYCPSGSLLPIPCPSTPQCLEKGNLQVDEICPAGSSIPLSNCQPCTAIPSNAYFTDLNSCSFCCTTGNVKVSMSSCIPISNTTSCVNDGQFMPVASACSVSIQTCQNCALPPSTQTHILKQIKNEMIIKNNLPAFGSDSCVYTCKPGYYNDSGCIPCPSGTFKNSTIINNCTSCPSGTYSSSPGSTACVACGKWGVQAPNKTTCHCVPGTFFSLDAEAYSNSDGVCIPCPSDSFSSPSEPYSCVRCVPGILCLYPPNMPLSAPCPAGSFRPTKTSSCAPCPVGFISSKSESTSCSQCSDGTFYSTSTSCSVCPNNTYSTYRGCVSCPIGTMSYSGSSHCGCPPGTYSRNGICVTCRTCSVNATTVTTCEAIGLQEDTTKCSCKNGWYGDGYISCIPCANASQCICPEDSFFNSTSGKCIGCDAVIDNIYCPSNNIIVSSQCVKGTVDYIPQKRCKCPNLHFYDSKRGCVPCKRCDPNAIMITPCSQTADTTACSCNDGFMGNGIVCLPCSICTQTQYLPINCSSSPFSRSSYKYNLRELPTCLCKPGLSGYGCCSAGFICPADKVIACPVGFYCPESNMVTAKPCSTGTFNNRTQATVCQKCASASLYQPFLNATACLSCPQNKNSLSSGGVSCS